MAKGEQPGEGWRQWVMETANTATAGFQPGPVIETAAPTPLSLPPGPPSFDVVEAMPPKAADRLRMLRQRSADGHRLIPEFETVRQASLAKIEAANALKRLLDHPGDGGFGMSQDSRQVTEAQRTLDRADADFRRLRELQTTRTAAWHQASGALAACEDWLRFGKPGNVVLEEVATEPPKLLKGESITDAIERLRRRGRELRADQHRIASAPFPSAYAKRRAREQVEALAMQGAPVVSNVIEHDAAIIWPSRRQQSEVISEQRSLAFAEVTDTLALTCWLHRDALIKRLDAEISAEADDGAALSHEQRQQAEAQVMGDLLSVERDEAWWVWQAQSDNLPCEHRGDISPLALLGLRLVTTPRAPDGPSSPSQAGYNLIGGR